MRSPKTLFLIATLTAAVSAEASAAAPTRILINHLGYETHGTKKFVVQSEQDVAATSFQILDGQGKAVLTGATGKLERVDGWKKGRFWRGDFSTLDKPGTYRVRVGDV